MIKIYLILISLVLFACTNEKNTFNLDKVRILGEEVFSEKKWAVSDQVGRGTMTYNLIKEYDLVGKNADFIENLLGEPTGYYIHDTYPSYVIGPETVSSDFANGHLLVFLTDKKRVVTEIFIEYGE